MWVMDKSLSAYDHLQTLCNPLYRGLFLLIHPYYICFFPIFGEETV